MKLDDKMRALIAVGAAVAANCQPCLQSAACMALKCGADVQEITEAVEVARTVRKCAASNIDRFAVNLNPDGEPVGGCGCGS